MFLDAVKERLTSQLTTHCPEEDWHFTSAFHHPGSEQFILNFTSTPPHNSSQLTLECIERVGGIEEHNSPSLFTRLLNAEMGGGGVGSCKAAVRSQTLTYHLLCPEGWGSSEGGERNGMEVGGGF